MRYAIALTLALSLMAVPALAERPMKGLKSAQEASLSALSKKELALLEPHLSQGPVLLTEFRTRQSDLPAIIFAAYVDAPAARIADLIAQPKNYPKFMSALDTIKVENRHKNMIAYKWNWQLSLFSMTGRNVMNIHPAPTTAGRPYRIDVRATEGDLGKGRMVWRIYPRDANRSTVVFSSRIDMRNANYISQQLASGGNSVNRSINIALASVMLLGTKEKAEKDAGTFKDALGMTALRRPTVDFEALRGLLRRGDLVFMKLDGALLQQVAVVGRSGAREDRMRRLMVDPEEFGKSLIHGSRAHVIEKTNSKVRFKWGIPLPLIGVDGIMALTPGPSIIAVDGEAGSLSESQWRFDTYRYRSGEAGVLGWAQFDPADTSKLIKRVIAGNKHFSHGLSVATQLMIMRSLRARARRYR